MKQGERPRPAPARSCPLTSRVLGTPLGELPLGRNSVWAKRRLFPQTDRLVDARPVVRTRREWLRQCMCVLRNDGAAMLLDSSSC